MVRGAQGWRVVGARGCILQAGWATSQRDDERGLQGARTGVWSRHLQRLAAGAAGLCVVAAGSGRDPTELGSLGCDRGRVGCVRLVEHPHRCGGAAHVCWLFGMFCCRTSHTLTCSRAASLSCMYALRSTHTVMSRNSRVPDFLCFRMWTVAFASRTAARELRPHDYQFSA